MKYLACVFLALAVFAAAGEGHVIQKRGIIGGYHLGGLGYGLGYGFGHAIAAPIVTKTVAVATAPIVKTIAVAPIAHTYIAAPIAVSGYGLGYGLGYKKW